jgi:hypothetical protein
MTHSPAGRKGFARLVIPVYQSTAMVEPGWPADAA